MIRKSIVILTIGLSFGMDVLGIESDNSKIPFDADIALNSDFVDSNDNFLSWYHDRIGRDIVCDNNGICLTVDPTNNKQQGIDCIWQERLAFMLGLQKRAIEQYGFVKVRKGEGEHYFGYTTQGTCSTCIKKDNQIICYDHGMHTRWDEEKQIMYSSDQPCEPLSAQQSEEIFNKLKKLYEMNHDIMQNYIASELQKDVAICEEFA